MSEKKEKPGFLKDGPKLLVIGSKGQLGNDLCKKGPELGFETQGLDLPEFDITNRKQVVEMIAALHPDLVVNAAAYTDVDGAETDRETAFRVNRDGPEHIAFACGESGVPMIHVSTDFVFDGRKRIPYLEDDKKNPLSVYGESKSDGEDAVIAVLPEHIIVRTAWLYGIQGKNFVKTIIRLAMEKEELNVIDDQKGSPTSSADLAGAILGITRKIGSESFTRWGIYHYCGKGEASWFEFAKAAIEFADGKFPIRCRNIHPIPTEKYLTPAVRPGYSVLDCRKILDVFDIETRLWKISLEETIRCL